MSIRDSRSAGFSVIELLLTAAILGVGLLGLAALTTTAMKGYGGSRVRDTATILATGVLDRLAVDGRISSQQRSNSTAIPASALVANATDDASNNYADPATTYTSWDTQGQPTNTSPVFTVSWVRRAAKAGATPAATSLQVSSEVVVNVRWNEVFRNTTTGVTTVTPRYISVSRVIRY